MPFTRILCLVLEINLRVGVFFCFVLDLCLFFHRMSTLSILQVNDIEDDDDSLKNNNNKVDFW